MTPQRPAPLAEAAPSGVAASVAIGADFLGLFAAVLDGRHLLALARLSRQQKVTVPSGLSPLDARTVNKDSHLAFRIVREHNDARTVQSNQRRFRP